MGAYFNNVNKSLDFYDPLPYIPLIIFPLLLGMYNGKSLDTVDISSTTHLPGPTYLFLST